MHEFRRFVRGPVGKVLLVLIILPFVISAFYGYFTGGNQNNAVAEVNGQSISKRKLDARVRQYRQRIKKQRPNMSDSMLDQVISPSMVLQGLVNNQLIYDYGRDVGMAVPDQQAAGQIRNSRMFQDEDGKFSRDIMKSRLRRAGMTPSSYMGNLRNDLLRQQVRTGFQKTAFALPRELASQRRLGEQTRTFRYAALHPDALTSTDNVDQEAVKKYYQEHRQDFMRPAEFKLNYVVLSPDQYRDQINITEADIKKEYQARLKTGEISSRSQPGRKAAHIMLTTGDQRSVDEARQKLQKMRNRIVSGASFAEVAQSSSEDPATADEGGKLGAMQRGDLPDSMNDALFDLDPGAVSEPVETEQGVHLVKRIGSAGESNDVPSLADKHDAIEKSLREGRIKSRITEDANQLGQLAFEHSGLQTPADKLDLKVQATDWFKLKQPASIATNKAVQEAMKTSEVSDKGRNSEVLDIGDGRKAVINIADHEAAQPQPREQVAGRIRASIKRQRARSKLDDKADEIDKALVDGETLTALKDRLDTRLATARNVQRGDRDPGQQLVKKAFTMPRPGDGVSGPELMRLNDGGLAVLSVTEVTDGNMSSLGDDQQQQALQRLNQRQGQRSMRSLMAWLRDQGKIDVHQDVVEGEAAGPGGGAQRAGSPQQRSPIPGQ